MKQVFLWNSTTINQILSLKEKLISKKIFYLHCFLRSVNTSSYNRACNYGYLIAFKEIAESFLGENLKEGYMRLLTFAQSLYEFIVTGTPSAWKIMPIISGYQPYIEPIQQSKI